jgi:hypothetical protein
MGGTLLKNIIPVELGIFFPQIALKITISIYVLGY